MTPAQYVIEKCGGISATARLTERTESVVYRWTYPISKGGTGGMVPQKAQKRILLAASRGEVDVRPEDFFSVPKAAIQPPAEQKAGA